MKWIVAREKSICLKPYCANTENGLMSSMRLVLSHRKYGLSKTMWCQIFKMFYICRIKLWYSTISGKIVTHNEQGTF